MFFYEKFLMELYFLFVSKFFTFFWFFHLSDLRSHRTKALEYPDDEWCSWCMEQKRIFPIGEDMYDRKEGEEKKWVTVWSEKEEHIRPEKCDEKSFDDKAPICSVSFDKEWWYTKEVKKWNSEEIRRHEIRFEVLCRILSWRLSLEKYPPWYTGLSSKYNSKKLDNRVYRCYYTSMNSAIWWKPLQNVEHDRSVIDENIDSLHYKKEDSRGEYEKRKKWFCASKPEWDNVNEQKCASDDAPRYRRRWWIFLCDPDTQKWYHTGEYMDLLFFSNEWLFMRSDMHIWSDAHDCSRLDSLICSIRSSHEEYETDCHDSGKEDGMYMDTESRNREINEGFHKKICDNTKDKKEDNFAGIFRMPFHIVHRKWCTTLRKEKKWTEEEVANHSIDAVLFVHNGSISQKWKTRK